MTAHEGFAGRVAKGFINSKLTPLVIAASLLLGLFAVIMLPREEEPQIVVPMLDIMVAMPGASPQEVEQRASIPMERLLRQIPGVEYVYSISRPGQSLVILRYEVGTKENEAIVRAYNQLYSHFDQIPKGVSPPLIKVRSIDDAPVMALTLSGKGYDGMRLRQIARELEEQIRQNANVGETQLIGGQTRQLRIEVDPARLNAYGLTLPQLAAQLQSADRRAQSGEFAVNNQQILVDAGDFLRSAEEARNVVVGVAGGSPVHLRDVATSVVDGAAEPSAIVLNGVGSQLDEAVTLTIAKRKGANATDLTKDVERRIASLRGSLLPADLQLTTTRNYGETAKEKSDELLKHLLIATLSVALLIALALGWREAGVVLMAVPVTLALTLAIFYFYGYTLNRVTLFALIFSIGILVDDAIVVVENIVRHFRLPENHGRSLSEVAVEAVAEVGNPTMLATFAVIGAILPLAFVRGLMGPYMRPIPVGASSAMLFSLAVAFVVSPWGALRLLRHYAEPQSAGGKEEVEGRATLLYRRLMGSLVHDGRRRSAFLVVVFGLLLLALAMAPAKLVRVKMLPFDNKSEFQVMVDMPDGSTLEQTTRAAQALGDVLARRSEVVNYQIYAGASGPINFNGLVRHYYMRHQPNQADIQVNLRPKEQRRQQSHEIARELRPLLVEAGRPYGARVKVAEVPPGPPVLETLAAEVYGPDAKTQMELARKVKEIFASTPGVVDVDWYVEDPQTRLDVRLDSARAAGSGVNAEAVTQTLSMALQGVDTGLLHDASAREDAPVHLQLTRAARSSLDDLLSLRLPSAGGSTPLREVVDVRQTTREPSVYRKNSQRVVYVTGDVAGGEESPVYAIMKMNRELDKLRAPDGSVIRRFNAAQPPDVNSYSMKWDGEWHITIEVFRDMGMAFAAVLVLIYVMIVGWFKSFVTPLVIMAPIPLTLVGILPAHAMVGAFFTATSMIGFIAGAGIIVRNSIILVDFIELRRASGMPLAEAVVDAGAVRFRPMLLTAAAVVVGSSVILFDPIFQGLALSLMAGEAASTVLSRMTVPVLYYMAKRHEEAPANVRQED